MLKNKNIHQLDCCRFTHALCFFEIYLFLPHAQGSICVCLYVPWSILTVKFFDDLHTHRDPNIIRVYKLWCNGFRVSNLFLKFSVKNVVDVVVVVVGWLFYCYFLFGQPEFFRCENNPELFAFKLEAANPQAVVCSHDKISFLSRIVINKGGPLKRCRRCLPSWKSNSNSFTFIYRFETPFNIICFVSARKFFFLKIFLFRG